MNKLALTAVVHQEGTIYVAYCPEVGTVSQGLDVEEAVRNLREATELYLEGEDPQQVIEFAPSVVRSFEAEVA